jgi:hypothetical protein
VSPGTYTVVLTAPGGIARQTVTVRGDPLMPITDAQYRDRESFLLAVAALQRRGFEAAEQYGVRLQGGFGPQAAPLAMDSAAAARSRLASALRGLGALAADMNGSGVRPGTLYPPTETQRRVKIDLESALAQAIATLERMGGGR